ncbi:hypothetical protein LV690_004904, partial [Escherichia coli]|nr:hypothetical protein [Escherichia coli]
KPEQSACHFIIATGILISSVPVMAGCTSQNGSGTTSGSTFVSLTGDIAHPTPGINLNTLTFEEGSELIGTDIAVNDSKDNINAGGFLIFFIITQELYLWYL